MGQKIIFGDDVGKLLESCDLESKLRETGRQIIAGVDEAGRGPLAGPVVAAAVILPDSGMIPGLDDSKKLSAARRDILFDRIVTSGAEYAVGIVDNEMIDRINILRASLRAMAQAVCKLSKKPDFVMVDGNQPIPNLELAQATIVGGDAICPSISAASIIAKVTRDRIMDHYDKLYADFSFSKHKGYPTAEHLDQLKTYGVTPIHRKSFKPVAEALSRAELTLA
ncbi:MAG: ribonuclease HII [candidate division Zixibacteria bacterium]